MGRLGRNIVRAFNSAVDFFVDVVQFIWDEAVMPTLENVFKLLGIEDESFVLVQKSSQLVYDYEGADLVAQANKKAAISMTKEGSSFYAWYMAYTRSVKADITAYYRYAQFGGYIHGLPEMEVRGGDIDFVAVDAALDLALGFAATRLSINTVTPSDEIYFKHLLQSAPYNYVPSNNTLTFTDPYGVSRNDYEIDTITYNASTGKHEIAISRVAEEALFWLEGPSSIVEGDNATYTVRCNRSIPPGGTVTINFGYGGTALSRRYIHVPSVDMSSGDSAIIVVRTDENNESDGNSTIIVSIDSVVNTDATFESVGIHAASSVTTTLADDEGIVLTLASAVVSESQGSLVIPVKLESTTSGPFTANYAMANGTATGGLDFDNTPGVLNFAGNAGEVQNITITINADAPDDNEYFTVYFTACSDPAVDFSMNCLVTITDGSDIFSTPGNATLSDVIIQPGYIREPSIVVTYHADTDPSTNWFYWVYKLSDGTYPDLDDLETILDNMEMLPAVIIKNEQGAVNEDKGSAEYLTSKRMLNILGLNIDALIDGIQVDDNYASVNDVYINFALSPTTEVELVSKGLWISFHTIIVANNLTSTSNEYTATFIEQAINNAIVWSEHEHIEDVPGVLANAGEYHHHIEIVPEIVEQNGEGNDVVVQESGSILHLEHQTAVGFYETLQIHNLNGLSSIRKESFHDIALNKLEDASFTIPVSYYVIDQLSPIEQMKLYEHIMRLDTYAAEIQHLDWYETKSFLNLFSAVLTIINVVTLGQASGPLEVLKQLLFQYIITELVIIIAIKTGNAELAALVGLVAMVAGNGLSGSTIDFASAEGMLAASTNFANNLTAAYDVEIKGIKEELDIINDAAEERLKEHEDAFDTTNPITANFLVALNSVDTTMFPAVKAQYDFDLIFNYDRLIEDYYDLNLRIGVT